MYVYNVTLKIDWTIAEQWPQWMLHEHMPEVMTTGCFEGCRLMRLLEVDDTDGPTFAAQYTAVDRAAYDRYIEQYADTYRRKSFDKWGNRFIAFRSVMQLVQ